VGGNVYAFDAATGHEYWKEFTGSSVVAPLSAYSVGGSEYLTVVVGEAGNQQTPNLPPTQGSHVIAYRLAAGAALVNDATGQVALANATNGSGESAASIAQSAGAAPYTQQQVAQGGAIYAKSCAVCHGDKLQGLSAPALTGAAFSHSHLNAAQLRGVVTQTMPLTAPGSLAPNDYAAVMAFLLSYDCVKAAGDGRQPFPTAPLPDLQQVTLGATTCAPAAASIASAGALPAAH